MDFEWNEAKNQSNLVKHKIGFELAERFDWHRAIIEADDRTDYGEDRYLARSYADDGVGYSIVFTHRCSIVRIISVRPFNKKEEMRYGKR